MCTKKCSAIVSIPCVGVKNSLNVGVALGICVYEISRQWHHEQQQRQQPVQLSTNLSPTGECVVEALPGK